MSKKFNKGELLEQNGRFGVVLKVNDESVEVEDYTGHPYNYYSPSKASKEEIKIKITNLQKEIKWLEKYL